MGDVVTREGSGKTMSGVTAAILDFSASPELLFKNNLSVSILGLYAGVSSVVWFSQAGEINFFIAKAVNKFFFIILSGDFNEDSAQKCASFKKCFDLSLVNFLRRSLFVKMLTWTNSYGVAKALDYILISLSLVNAVIDGSMAGVEDYFDTNHKVVSVSVGLGGLLDIQLSLLCKQINKNHWKFDVKNADEVKWGEFKDATAANTVMFLDEFGSARNFSDLDAIYNKVFTKESFKLHNLEILVLKIVKTFHEMDFGWFKSLLRHWVSLDSDRASVVRDFMSFGASLNNVYSVLYGIRRSYCAFKLAELLQTKELGIRSAIERRMENFVVNKSHTICSVLEHPFCKVVLDHLVSDNDLILDPVEVKSKVDGIIKGWIRKKAMLKSVPDLCLDNLIHVIKDLPNSKAADLFGISNELWKHCDGSVLSLLLDLLNICLVSMIPKPYEWKGVLTNIRLIALIETACKILSKLLFIRILLAYSLFNILCGDNFSMLKSTTIQSPIFAIGLVVKDILKKDYKLWLVLQDMCKAYDSGEIFSLLLWKIFYDLLLCEVKRQENLCGYQIDTKFVARTGRIENQGSLTSFLAADAFVDDTIWVSSSQAATQHILNTVSEFFKVNNISINNKKTVKKSHWYLGIYLLSENLFKPSLAKVYTDIRFFVNLVLKKAILDKQRGLRLKARLLRDFPNEAFHYSSLYDLKFFEQLQTEYKVVSVLCFLNTSGVLGCLFNHRSLDLQVLSWSSIHPLCCPVKLYVSPVNNFLDYDMSLNNLSVSVFHFSGEMPIFTLTLACDFLDHSFISNDLHVKGLQAIVFAAQIRSSNWVNDLGLCKMKCGTAAYFPDLDLGIGARVSRLVLSTMAELQAIALALKCVLSDSLVVVYLDSQDALNACVAESALIEQHGIVNLIKRKQLDVFWCKIKEHLGVIDNEHADKLASLVVSSDLALPVLEVGSGFDVIDNSLLGDVDWSHTALVWHSDSHMVAGFISKSTASLHSYFLKVLYYHLSVAV
ncbi:hypothetical protein G9A89_020215 [Geosiphon pyriformis]|nr:hypothetical protein G9A89_020215 [Geosiphon pyriformis]